MPADTNSALLGLLLQGTGNNDNTWGQLLNEQTIQLIENAIAGRTAYVVNGGTDTLSATEHRSAILDFSGTLLADQTITVANTSKTWNVNNGCTLGGFVLKMKTSGGAAVTIPAGKWTVWCDGADGVFVAASAALVAIGSLTPAADKLAYFTSATAGALADLTSFARTILDDADAATVRTTLGLVIGTNVQAFDSDLATIAANITAAGHSLLDDANAAAQRTTLGLGTSAIIDTGTSGTKVALLDGANTWSGAAAFGSTLAVTGALTANNAAGVAAVNTAKAVVGFTTNGAGVVTIHRSFNVASVATATVGGLAGFLVTFTTALADDNYAVMINSTAENALNATWVPQSRKQDQTTTTMGFMIHTPGGGQLQTNVHATVYIF